MIEETTCTHQALPLQRAHMAADAIQLDDKETNEASQSRKA
jgi:hypothetical protein